MLDIERTNVLEDLCNYAISGSGVVVGPPGIGKTYLLKRMCQRFLDQKQPSLYLAIDQLGAIDNETALMSELGVRNDWISFLKDAVREPDIQGVLILDSFDAARSENTQRFFLRLIERTIQHLSGRWNVIVSVRTYDARKSPELLDLFPRSPRELISDIYQASEIPCRHFIVLPLTDEDVDEVMKSNPLLRELFKNDAGDLRQLLKVPFNLNLLVKMLNEQSSVDDLTPIRSEVELLGKFWDKRVNRDSHDLSGHDKAYLLTKIAKYMVEHQTLALPRDIVYEDAGASVPVGRVLDALLSLELLMTVGSGANMFAFAHNILFDFAVSVLLIRDETNQLASFIAQGPSRQLFLRPSLMYYLTRQWYGHRELFWRIFWSLIKTDDRSLRLFARLLPPTVAVNELRTVEDLSPVLVGLHDGRKEAEVAALRVLQALRAFGSTNDLLWVQAIGQIAQFISESLAWEIATHTIGVLDRALQRGDRTIGEQCGRIGRQLLRWIWERRKGAPDRLTEEFGARFVIPIVAKTFATSPIESRVLLEPIFEMAKESRFPIGYFYWLIPQLPHIWPTDSDFAVRVYEAVFTHEETSEEQTKISDSLVLSLTSTRRQDFEMCRYLAAEIAPAFLKEAPVAATQAIVDALNLYLPRHHLFPWLKREIKPEELFTAFSFHGWTAHYLDDYVTTSDESSRHEEAIKMADALFALIQEMAASGDSDQYKTLDTIIDTVGNRAITSYIWRRLLLTCASAPEIMAEGLYDLAAAQPLLARSDALYEIGQYLSCCTRYLPAERRINLERLILSIVDEAKNEEERQFLEGRRNRLIAQLPSALLTFPESIAIRHTMEVEGLASPIASPPGTSVTWHKYTTDDWLREQNVDVDQPENDALKRYFDQLSNFTETWTNNIPSSAAIESILPIVRQLHQELMSHVQADMPVVDAAWTKLAETVSLLCRAAIDPMADLFVVCRQIILECASHRLPRPDNSSASDFKHGSWSPAPRNEAAEGLPWLAARLADEDILGAIEQLSKDEAHSVRMLIAYELWRLRETAPDRFWRTMTEMAETEQSPAVQVALCHSLSLSNDSGERIASILRRLQVTSHEDSQASREIVNQVTWLAHSRQNTWAIDELNSYLSNPVSKVDQLSCAAWTSIHPVTPENIARPSVQAALHWLQRAARITNKAIYRILKAGDPSTAHGTEQLDEPVDVQRLRNAIAERFSLEDLELLCADVGIDREELSAQTKTLLAQQLVEKAISTGKLAALLASCAEHRPGLTWRSLAFIVGDMVLTESEERLLRSMNNEELQSTLQKLESIIHQVVIHIEIVLADRDRKYDQATKLNFYLQIKPLLMDLVAMNSSHPNVVMFPATAHALLGALNTVLGFEPEFVLNMATHAVQLSTRTGFHLDSMAVGETVKLVETALSTYRTDIRTPESVANLMNLLDIFADVGWPEAIRLVWRLDEVYR